MARKNAVIAVAIVLLGTLGFSASASAGETSGESSDPAPREKRAGETAEYFGAQEFRVTASTGVDFSTGDFGGVTGTDIISVPVAVKLEWDPIVLKLTVPYIKIDGDVVPVGGAPELDPRVSGQRAGLGDVVLSGSYVYYPSHNLLPVVDLTAKIKFGTADETEGLGSGENDYTLQVDLSRSFGRVTPFVAGGYKFIGDPPDQSLRNKAFAFGGVSLKISKIFNVGVIYDWSQSVVATRPDFHELSPFATIKLGQYFAIDPYMVIGLSPSAADWGAGLQLRFIYDRY